MSSTTAAAVLQEVLDQLDRISGRYCAPAYLTGLTETALRIPGPEGDPDTVRAQAAAYSTAMHTIEAAGLDLEHVASSALPGTWRGAAAETATQALSYTATQNVCIWTGFRDGHKALSAWADKLGQAQKRFRDGRQQLNEANHLANSPSNPAAAARFASLATSSLPQALQHAKSGCRDMLAATNLAHSAANDAITALNQSAIGARARQITAPGIDPLTAASLAYAGPLSSPTAMARASQRLAAMSAADRAAFDKLVADAKSPQEGAYLWKALAAGYTTTQVAAFDKVVHPHGNNPAWLTRHLDPQVDDANTTPGAQNQNVLSYDGVNWVPEKPGANLGYNFYGQGSYGDCVAASTVVAKLNADPVQMLGVTTGRGPAAVAGARVGDDSVSAVHSRLQNLYTQNYDAGQIADGVTHPNTTNGIGGPGEEALDKSLLTPATGSQYQIQPLDGAAARQHALPGIEAAVEAGKPVPVDVEGTHGAYEPLPHRRPEEYDETDYHQMVIERAQGNELEIYNPWGDSQWVTKQQFVDGYLGALTSDDGSPYGGMPTPDEVQVPK